MDYLELERGLNAGDDVSDDQGVQDAGVGVGLPKQPGCVSQNGT